jgi:NAD(P) transhydrogenase subunit beta
MSDTSYYIICAVLAIGVLIGLALMSKVKTSVFGNGLSAAVMTVAILITLYKYNILTEIEIWVCLAIGFILGLIGAYKVKMIEMPQAVALLNGFGGATSAFVGIITLLDSGELDLFSTVTAGITVAVGMITFTGSLVAAGKLHKLLSQKPVVLKGHGLISTVNILLMILAIIGISVVQIGSSSLWIFTLACFIISGLFGVIFAIRVGGADMPITISLLNSLSGVSGSIAGMAINDYLLVAVGGIVGASGLLLTQIMCRSMNRSLADILLGKTSVSGKSDSDNSENTEVATEAQNASDTSDKTIKLSEAKRVIIVPGYGMALAQAQSLVKVLTDKLEKNGAVVKFAIHPVAGRMPGHMNILLAEADIDYEKLYEMDAINPEFAECDVAIIVGANDVVNPAANTAEGTPIYGMPIIEAEKAKQIIICNYDLKPGYAGVPNPLYSKENVIMMLGDAKESLEKLIESI